MSDNTKRRTERDIKKLKGQVPEEFMVWLKGLPLADQIREIKITRRNLGLLNGDTDVV